MVTLDTNPSEGYNAYNNQPKLLVSTAACGWPFYEDMLVTTLSFAFPCIEYYPIAALAKHALALRHQHLGCFQLDL